MRDQLVSGKDANECDFSEDDLCKQFDEVAIKL